MINTKLIKLIKSFNQYEIRQLKDFVHSPFFNKNKTVSRLFDELKKFYPGFENENLTENHVFEKIFPGEEFDYFKFRNASSDLFKLCMDFLSLIRFKKDNFRKEHYRIQELFVRGLDGIFLQTLKSAEKENESSQVKDENYLSRKIDLLEESISFNTLRRPNDFINLQQDKLDLYTSYALIKFLKFYDIMLHEEKQNNVRYKMNMIDEVMNYIENNKIEDNPTLLIYYNIILLERERKDVHFYKLKELRKKYFNELSEYDKYMSFLHMIGYCAQMYNVNSRTDLLREHFELVRERNEHMGLADVGKILYPDFINEVKIALRVDELQWAEEYIEKNKDKLETERDGALNFCNALINYKHSRMDEALVLLSKTYFPNFILKLQVKILQLQICIEKQYFDQALSIIDAFRHYIKREKTIKDDFKKTFYEYLRLSSDLIKLKSGDYGNEKKFHSDRLKREIDEMPGNQFGIKLWIKEQLCET